MRPRSAFVALRKAPKTGTPGFLMAGARGEESERAAFGLTVTRKLGGAVARNRIKRRLRAVIAQAAPGLAPAGWRYNLIARPAAATRPFALLLDDFKRALLTLERKTK